ncbi:MAG TPA: hypothetical protein VIM33_03110 [Gaiellaceae bacterium]|jgi:hypothetical protein
MAAWYPKRESYFADLKLERTIFQGDIFRGVPTAFVGHPAAREAAFAMEPAPTPGQAERPLRPEEIRDATTIKGSYSMLLPHPCDFSAGEKGATHSVRQVARLEPIRNRFSWKDVNGGRVHHAIWVPAWDSDDVNSDWFVDVRSATPVDAAYLNPVRRVAALSGPAWIALMRRLAFFYTRLSVDDRLLVLEQGHQHPDYAELA